MGDDATSVRSAVNGKRVGEGDFGNDDASPAAA